MLSGSVHAASRGVHGDDGPADAPACELSKGGALGCRRPLERDAAGNPSAALPSVAALCKPVSEMSSFCPFTLHGVELDRVADEVSL